MAETYRMLASISAMHREGQPSREFQPVTDIDYNAETYPTPLVELKEFFDTSVFMMDSLRKAIEARWVKFGNLIRMLEAHADDADFFSGIA